MKLTSYLIQKRIRSLLAQADKRQPTFCPLSEASNILLLYHIADEEQLKPGIARLQQLYKPIHRGIYLPKGEQQPNEAPRTFFLSEKTDLGTWQIPSSSRQESVEEKIGRPVQKGQRNILVEFPEIDLGYGNIRNRL